MSPEPRQLAGGEMPVSNEDNVLTYRMAAILYEDGPSFDGFMQEFANELRIKGHVLSGVIQINQDRQNSRHCDMLLEDLATGRTVVISEDRGGEARGCRLNVAALLEAGMTIRQSLSEKTDLLLINKFGKMESEGGGLRDLIVEASLSGVPVLVGVPVRNKQAWQEFCGTEADLLAQDPEQIKKWTAGALSMRPARL